MNTGHGPGFRYDAPVAPKGSFRGAMLFIYIVGGIIYVAPILLHAIF